MFDGGPLGHIEADFGEDGLGGEGIDAIDLGKINAGELEKVKAEVIIRAVIAVASGASGWGEGVLVEVKLRFGSLIVGLELLITGLDLAGIEIIGFEGLL